MKLTIQQAKDKVAKEYDKCDDFNDFMAGYLVHNFDNKDLDDLLDKAITLYAEEKCREQRELCAEQYKINEKPPFLKWIASAIENAPLATETNK